MPATVGQAGNLRAVVLLAGCGLASIAVYLGGFTLPYGLAGGIEKPLLHFGHLSGFAPGPAVALVLGFAALFVLYLKAIDLARTLEDFRPALAIAYGGGALSALALIWMYPVFSLDVFYYMAADRIWTVFRENPFVVPPLQAAHDPFFPYNRWGHYPLPYGPLWPWISAATSYAASGDLLATLLSFKVLGALGYLACMPLVTWAALALTPARPLTATVLFAWNPLVLIELPGNAHNDAIALIPVVLAVGLWLKRATAWAALSMAVSVLVKATAIVGTPALLMSSVHRAAAARRLPTWVATHVLPAVGIAVVAWLPWQTAALTSPFRETGQYYQSISALVSVAFARNEVPIRVAQLLLLAAFAVAYLGQRHTLANEGRPALTALWGLTVFYFLAVAPFLSAWYMIWPAVYAAILAEPRTTRLTTLLCAGALGTYVHQFVIRPALNLGFMESSAVGLAIIALPFLAGLGWTYLKERSVTLARVQAGTA